MIDLQRSASRFDTTSRFISTLACCIIYGNLNVVGDLEANLFNLP